MPCLYADLHELVGYGINASCLPPDLWGVPSPGCQNRAVWLRCTKSPYSLLERTSGDLGRFDIVGEGTEMVSSALIVIFACFLQSVL